MTCKMTLINATLFFRRALKLTWRSFFAAMKQYRAIVQTALDNHVDESKEVIRKLLGTADCIQFFDQI